MKEDSSTSKSQTLKIENDNVKVSIKNGEMISGYTDKLTNQSVSMPTKFYIYPGVKGKTLSGLYVFNPTTEARQHDLKVSARHVQRGQLQTIVHSFYELTGSKVRVAQAITINNVGDSILKRSVRVTTKMATLDYGEYTMRTDISGTFSKSDTEFFTDNSADTSRRQYYTQDGGRVFNLTKSKKTEWIGLNGYATIHGSAFRSSDDHYFAWANSNSLLVSLLGRSQYEIMLMRNTNYYDDKGITDPLRDNNIETFDQILFLATSTDEYYDMKKKVSAALNVKLITQESGKTYASTLNTHGSSLLGGTSLSANFGDIDILDLKVLDKDKINLKIRNKSPYIQTLNAGVNVISELPTAEQLNTEPRFKVSFMKFVYFY